jgi:hypothetical protein
MTFSETFQACTNNQVVYHKGEACVITYTTAGGAIQPAEGISNIRKLGETQTFRVDNINLDAVKSLLNI